MRKCKLFFIEWIYEWKEKWWPLSSNQHKLRIKSIKNNSKLFKVHNGYKWNCIIEISESVEVYTEYTYCLSKTFCSQDRWLYKNKLLIWLFSCFKKTCWISCLEERCLIPRIHLLVFLHSPTAPPSSFLPSICLSSLPPTLPPPLSFF